MTGVVLIPVLLECMCVVLRFFLPRGMNQEYFYQTESKCEGEEARAASFSNKLQGALREWSGRDDFCKTHLGVQWQQTTDLRSTGWAAKVALFPNV